MRESGWPRQRLRALEAKPRPDGMDGASYPMPRDTNIRRVFVDERTAQVTFSAGSNHDAAVVKVEPLD